MLCTNACGCAITSPLETVSIAGSGTPEDPWRLDTANASSITQLQVDVADLFDAIEALPGTYVRKVGDAMSGQLALSTPGGGITLANAGDSPFMEWYRLNASRLGYIQGVSSDNTFRVVADSGMNLLLMANATELMRLAAAGNAVLMFKTSTGVANTGFEMLNTNTLSITRGDTAQCIICNKVSSGASGSGSIFMSFQLAGTQIGSITRNAATSAVLYNTSSDEELKNVIGEIDGELAEYVLRLITPMFFSWKDDEGNTPIAGYIAQQVARAWPESIELGIVTPGYGDITQRTFDSDGNETTEEGVWGPWQMAITGLIPLLHAFLARKAWQLDNLRAEFDEYKAATESRLAALEMK